jgi:prepilin-type processing-associated H-X9-DG protein
MRNFNAPESVGKLDYAINAGDGEWGNVHGGPTSLEEGDSGFVPLEYDRLGYYIDVRPGASEFKHPMTGISFRYSEVGARHVADGTSNTYLIGEKGVHPDEYETVPDYPGRGDGLSWITGYDTSGTRSGVFPPKPDSHEYRGDLALAHTAFGSAHPAGLHMAFCDGSVRVVEYDVDPLVHQAAANRHDGQVFGN